MKIKEAGMVNQQLEDLMEHLVASCNRGEAFRLMSKVNDRITYIDTIEANFNGGLYGRAN